jgi:hypothetical protein
MIADLNMAGLHQGYLVLSGPTIRETWGHDMDVPDIML